MPTKWEEDRDRRRKRAGYTEDNDVVACGSCKYHCWEDIEYGVWELYCKLYGLERIFPVASLGKCPYWERDDEETA